MEAFAVDALLTDVGNRLARKKRGCLPFPRFGA
jgi:hypothetical protein